MTSKNSDVNGRVTPNPLIGIPTGCASVGNTTIGKLCHSLLPFRSLLIDCTHDGFEPPRSAASGAVAARVESSGNRAQAMATRSQFANCGKSRLLGRVRLDMDPVR